MEAARVEVDRDHPTVAAVVAGADPVAEADTRAVAEWEADTPAVADLVEAAVARPNCYPVPRENWVIRWCRESKPRSAKMRMASC